MRHADTVTPVTVRREWERLRRHPAAIHRAAGWHLVAGPLTDLDQIVERLSSTAADEEATLRRLVLVAAGDELAARVVLQRLVPDLADVHRRRSRQAWALQLDVGFGDLLATAWTLIRTFNPGRRPARLAHALVSDVEYREYRAGFRRIGHGVPVDPLRFDELIDTHCTDPAVELAAIVSDAGDHLDAADRDLIHSLVSGRPTTDIAEELGVTARTVRNRRERIVVRLREAAVAA